MEIALRIFPALLGNLDSLVKLVTARHHFDRFPKDIDGMVHFDYKTLGMDVQDLAQSKYGTDENFWKVIWHLAGAKPEDVQGLRYLDWLALETHVQHVQPSILESLCLAPVQSIINEYTGNSNANGVARQLIEHKNNVPYGSWLTRNYLEDPSAHVLTSIASALGNKGVRCAESDMIRMSGAFVVGSGQTGLALLALMFATFVDNPATRTGCVMAGDNLLREALNIGVEVLDLTTLRCQRGIMHCSCKSITPSLLDRTTDTPASAS